MRIIPAIDIVEGKCVRLTQGNFDTKKIYNENPLEVAKTFEEIGLKYLHLVDLDGAKAKKLVNWKVLESIARETTLEIDFGGGIQSNNDLRVAFECGAKQINTGSAAVNDPELVEYWIMRFGAKRIILSADAHDGVIVSSAWQKKSTLKIEEFITTFVELGLKHVISTDIMKDGMLEGPSYDMYQQILDNFPNINLIASGGISSIKDLAQLEEMKLEGAIIGKAIYENTLSLKDINQYIIDQSAEE